MASTIGGAGAAVPALSPAADPVSCTLGRREAKRGPINILAQLRHAQLSGRGLTRGSQITGALLKERDKQAKWNGIPLLLQKLYETSHANSDFSQCQSILKVSLLDHFQSNITVLKLFLITSQ
ncbi:PREDICTED: short transient receptor potential channel 4-associated protein-like [Thamnophis sirtalis]|uniref:Short transient receptor potential channel 4-associated protein-like n=1 Tax=Thamnophis sirtalis TaxID=35019 RepID=A0A6I9XKL0_9SAUR|nr:PREDICTED: short transient receptor potential channel 4-associated protein-like [Thamnophis sirtalis]